MMLNSILEKALSFKRLNDDELLCLLEERENIKDIARAADTLNLKINSNKVSYVVNRNINFTNICDLNCRFCGYKRTK
ncbi:MAG TPA: 7,8-didemethyl-8-hydroxy-5-deazariboflavin synthase subunit CofH, partial [bacterium]|nr:7,8-didemethyl-8-hydroxy-5-deazariboflavin synthase subunit CofH [bacterium]